MVLYHGTNHGRIKNFRISKKLLNSNAPYTVEGLGVYCSKDLSVSKSYGKYTYVIEVDDKKVIDYTKKNNCKKIINALFKEVYKKLNIDLKLYIDNETICNLILMLQYRNFSVSDLVDEIMLLLDSNSYFYFDFTETKIKRIRSVLNKKHKELTQAYLFNYNIKDCCIIKDTSAIKILKVIRNY